MKLATEANAEFRAFPDGYESFERFRNALFAPLLELAGKTNPRDFQVSYDPVKKPNDIEIFMASPCHNAPDDETVAGDFICITLSTSGTAEVFEATGHRQPNGEVGFYPPTVQDRSFPITQLSWDDDPDKTPELVAIVQRTIETYRDRFEKPASPAARNHAPVR